jgi:hypothetical protein
MYTYIGILALTASFHLRAKCGHANCADHSASSTYHKAGD